MFVRLHAPPEAARHFLRMSGSIRGGDRGSGGGARPAVAGPAPYRREGVGVEIPGRQTLWDRQTWKKFMSQVQTTSETCIASSRVLTHQSNNRSDRHTELHQKQSATNSLCRAAPFGTCGAPDRMLRGQARRQSRWANCPAGQKAKTSCTYHTRPQISDCSMLLLLKAFAWSCYCTIMVSY